ncbi:MAG: TonB-dependent receptor plug domain-containing protein, partial [Pseudomonadota bacterium]
MAGQGTITLDPIIVEGELQNRTLQETQTSVAVITGEDLDRRDDFDLYDVIERTPNVTSSFGEKGFAIRGIDQRGPGSAGNGLLVNVTVDGATLPDNTSSFFGPYSTWDLQQVEVLRGPQSTQQGRNALAGAIIIRSADPTYDFEVKGRAEVAQRGSFGGAFALNVPVVEDKFALRFAAEHVQTDGFVDNPTLDIDDYDAREQTTLRAKARFDPTEDLSAILSLSFVRNFGGEDFVESATFPGERFNFSDVEAEEGADQIIGNLRVNYDFNSRLSLQSETSFYDNNYVRVEDIDQTGADQGFLDRDTD